MGKRLGFWAVLLMLLCAAPSCLAGGEVARLTNGEYGFVLPEGYYLINRETLPALEQNEALYGELEGFMREADWLCRDKMGVTFSDEDMNVIVNEAQTICLFIEAAPGQVMFGEKELSAQMQYSLWAGERLKSVWATERATLSVGEIVLQAAGGKVTGRKTTDGYSLAALQAADSEGRLLRITILWKDDADLTELKRNLLGLTRDSEAHDLTITEPEQEDASAWRAYRMDYVLGADGEKYAPEDCGAENDASLLIGGEYAVFVNGYLVETFWTSDVQREVLPAGQNKAFVYEDEEGLFCYGASWADENCLPHFVLEDGDVDEEELESRLKGRLKQMTQKIAAPMSYGGETQMRRWAGLWGAEYEGKVYLFELRTDGTMDCRIVSSWLSPDEALETQQLSWRAIEDGIQAWGEDGETQNCRSVDQLNDLYMPCWVENGRMRRLSGYEAMRSSIPEGVSPESVLGVWRADRVQVGEDVQDVQLRLNPDGSCVRIIVVRPGGDAKSARMREKEGWWRFGRDGRTIMLCDYVQDSDARCYFAVNEPAQTILGGFADGQLSVRLTDGLQAEASREAGMESWSAGDYGAQRLVNYVSSGLVGVWEVEFWDAPQDGRKQTLRIYADPTGKVRVTCAGREALGSWKPTQNGMTISLRQELSPIIEKDKFDLKRGDNRHDLLNATTLNGSLMLKQTEDYWEADFTSANEADFTVKDGVLTSYRGDDAEIVIPASLGVTAIGERVFKGSGATRIVLPSGVTAIGAQAFQECRQLCEVVLPSGVTTIGAQAFQECRQLCEVVLPKGLKEIGEHAFEECTALERLDLPEGLEKIGNDAFQLCSGLTEMEIPFGIKDLAGSVLYGCDSLRTLTLPSGLRTIGANAFGKCKSLQAIVIPQGVQRIDRYAFWGCEALECVELPASITTMENTSLEECKNVKAIVCPNSSAEKYCKGNGISYTARPAEEWDFAMTKGVLTAYQGDREQVWISKGMNVAQIGEDAFANHTQLRAVRIDEGVSALGAGAFRGCAGLTEATLPKSLKEIGEDAFSGCDNLTAYVHAGSAAHEYCVKQGIRFELLDDSVDYVVEDGRLMEYLGADTELIIPDSLGITRVNYRALYQNETIRRVVIPEGVTSLGQDAFAYCTALEEVVLPESLEEIGSAFSWCKALKKIDLPEGLTEIGDSAFYGSGLTGEMTLPSALEEIGNNAFGYCEGLTKVVLPEGIEYIGRGAFFSCGALTSVNLPSTLWHIGMEAFRHCTSLTEVTVAMGVDSFMESVFEDCTALREIYLPISVTEFDEDVFANCPNLTLIVEAGSAAETYARKNGLAWRRPGGEEAASVPETPLSAFDYRAENGEIVIVKYIGQEQTVRIPARINDLPVTKIGPEAFAENEELLKVIVPEGVLELGDMAFFDCSKLLEAELPESLQAFGRFVFSNCPQLRLRVWADSAAETYAGDANLVSIRQEDE